MADTAHFKAYFQPLCFWISHLTPDYSNVTTSPKLIHYFTHYFYLFKIDWA